MEKILFIIFSVMLNKVFCSVIFPQIDDFSNDCKLPDGSKGTCRNLKYCPAAVTAKEVKTCYYEGFEEFVCCKENVWDDINMRPITADCGAKPPFYEIISGLKTVYKEFPYMVALGWPSLLDSNLYEYKCGGVLITTRYILTAAHCAVLNGLAPVVALIGGPNLTDTSYKPLRIENVISHPGYRKNETYHDIALIKLAEPTYDKPICVWGSYSLDETNLTAIGYGHTQFAGAYSVSLLKAYLLVVSNNDCTTHYKTEPSLPNGIVGTQICAKDPENIRDTCQGDSGGPIILHSTDKYGVERPFVVGITSFGRGCALEPPGVYTRVSEYIDWIEKIAFADN